MRFHFEEQQLVVTSAGSTTYVPWPELEGLQLTERDHCLPVRWLR